MEARLLVITLLDPCTSYRTKLLTIPHRVLLNNERLLSSSLGRPCSVKAQEWVMEYHISSSPNLLFSYDLELPIDCDDEYWPVDDKSEGFKQPPGKPSKLAAFILMIKLLHIQANVVRMMVSAIRCRAGSQASIQQPN